MKRNDVVTAVDNVSPLGSPRIIVRDKDGVILQDFTAHNLVVQKGRNSLVRMLMGDFSSRLNSIELGGGGVSGDVWTPVNPTASDLGVAVAFNPVVQKVISGKVYASGTNPTSASFSLIFESYEVNQIVSEAVLKFLDGSIYARYTFPSVYLRQDRGYSMEIIWTILFN